MYGNMKSHVYAPVKPDLEDDDEDARTIFCANLDQRVTEEILYEVFLQAGPIESVRIPKDGGRQKTFGFITYVHKCSVPYALQLLAGLSLFKKCLTIKVRQMPSSGGGSAVSQQDNFALRGNNFSSHKKENPFRRDDISTPMGADWTPSRRNDESRQKTPHKQDNSALWGNNFSIHCEKNPFKRDVSPPRGADWAPLRQSDELKKHSSHNSHQHQTTPYSRPNSRSKDGGGHQNQDHNRHGGRSNRSNRHR